MPKGHLPVVSYLAVPVLSRSGEVHGGLFFGHDKPGVFSEKEHNLAAGIAVHAGLAIDNANSLRSAQVENERRRRAEEQKDLLLNEVKHRAKNTLATVQAIAAAPSAMRRPTRRRRSSRACTRSPTLMTS